MCIAYQPVDYSTEVLTNVFVCSFDLKIARVSVTRKESPVTDGSDISPFKRLGKSILIEMLDQFLIDSSVVAFVSE